MRSDRKSPEPPKQAATDPQSQREQALEATGRIFSDRGFTPDQDSDEWEEEYRRQFALVKARHAAKGTAAPAAEDSIEESDAKLPPLTGPITETRWAATLRADRLPQIARSDIRAYVSRHWTTSKQWLATEKLSEAQFLRRAEAQFGEHRKRLADQAAAQARAQVQKATANAELRRKVSEAGISAAGLVELIDLSARRPTVALGAKIVDLIVAGRQLRIFDSSEPGTLMVQEKSATGRADYGIERDAGLVGDLQLFAAAQER